jgi:hypothetical protein
MFKRMKVPALVATILVTLAAVVAGGCGSSSGDGTTQTTHRAGIATQRTAPADAAFVASADRVCDEINGKLAGLDETTDENFAAVSGSAVAIVRGGVARLRAIDPPAQRRGDYDHMVKLLDEQNDLFDQARTAWLARDTEKAQTASDERDRVNAEQDAVALELGLRACAASADDRSRGARSGS